MKILKLLSRNHQSAPVVGLEVVTFVDINPSDCNGRLSLPLACLRPCFYLLHLLAMKALELLLTSFFPAIQVLELSQARP